MELVSVTTMSGRPLTFAAAIVAAQTMWFPSPAKADVPPNCEVRPWGFLGSMTRIICDSPIRPDGSWLRERFIGVLAHYEYPSSHCSSGTYYNNCTYYPGGWVDTRTQSDETYEVRADNVLPDEPGHLPNPAPQLS